MFYLTNRNCTVRSSSIKNTRFFLRTREEIYLPKSDNLAKSYKDLDVVAAKEIIREHNESLGFYWNEQFRRYEPVPKGRK